MDIDDIKEQNIGLDLDFLYDSLYEINYFDMLPLFKDIVNNKPYLQIPPPNKTYNKWIRHNRINHFKPQKCKICGELIKTQKEFCDICIYIKRSW